MTASEQESIKKLKARFLQAFDPTPLPRIVTVRFIRDYVRHEALAVGLLTPDDEVGLAGRGVELRVTLMAIMTRMVRHRQAEGQD